MGARDGIGVGAGLGRKEIVGLGVGTGVGAGVGTGVGASLGTGVLVGTGVGCGDGVGVGCGLGSGVGTGDGWMVGRPEGAGEEVGMDVMVGWDVGLVSVEARPPRKVIPSMTTDTAFSIDTSGPTSPSPSMTKWLSVDDRRVTDVALEKVTVAVTFTSVVRVTIASPVASSAASTSSSPELTMMLVLFPEHEQRGAHEHAGHTQRRE